MEIEKKLTELGTAFEDFKKANDARLDEIKKYGVASGLTEEKVGKVEAHIAKLEASIETMTKAMQRTGNGVAETEEQKSKKEMQEYKNAVRSYMRKCLELPKEMKDFATKEMSVDSDEDGGFFVDTETNGKIVTKLFESSPIRQLADKMTISSDSYKFIYDGDEAGSGWVGETQARTVTSSPQIKEVVIPVHELYASPRATQKLLDDAAVNLENWLAGKVSEKFARDEATAFMSGNGVGKPKGILAYANAAAGFNQVQVNRTATATAIVGDDLIATQEMLKEGYQNNASWLINRLIIGQIRRLKDVTSGQYIWQPGLMAGAPNQLLGKPVYMASDLDSTLAIDKYTAIYGDVKAGYLIVDRVGIRVLRDPYTAKPYVIFYTTKRVGGGVQDGDALKIMQQKAN
jgi:HK97 family phage major capsid protein